MIFSQKNLYKPLKYFVIVSAILLIGIFIVLQFYIPEKLTEYLKENPNWGGYSLKIDRINYSLFSGFNFNNIELSDPKKNEKYIKINKLNLDLDFLSSIIKNRAVIGFIKIDKIESSISQQLLKELSNLSAHGKTDTVNDKQKSKTGLVLEKLLIDNLDIIYDKEYRLSLNDLILTLDDVQNPENISLRSSIKILEKEFILKSKIRRTSSAAKASVDLQTPVLELL
ncbi:MAG: hypothetical protein ACR2NW_03925, partial [Thermodesulfobacteriota bacterium]